MKHVVITGGAGFVGSHMADALLARGERVTVVDNLLTGKEENLRHLASEERFTFLRQDVIDGQALTYGQSITDPCMSWTNTEPLLHELAEAVAQRRG